MMRGANLLAVNGMATEGVVEGVRIWRPMLSHPKVGRGRYRPPRHRMPYIAQETRAQNALDDFASNMSCRALPQGPHPGLCTRVWSALLSGHHPHLEHPRVGAYGCHPPRHSTHETKVPNALDDMVGNICQALPAGN